MEANSPLAGHDDWLLPESRALDNSVYEFLKSVGWSDATIAQNYETNIGRGTSAHDCSILTWYFRVAWNEVQRQLGALFAKVEGGNQRLPETMAAALPGDVLLQRHVTGIAQDQRGVEVLTDDGERHLAGQAICTLPVTPLRWVGFDPVLPPVLARAMKVLPSMMVTKTFLHAERNFWEDDGLDPAMWTDSPLGEVRALRQFADSPEITGLIARARGFTALRLDRLGEAAARARVVSEYERLRPRPAANSGWWATRAGTWTRMPAAPGPNGNPASFTTICRRSRNPSDGCTSAASTPPCPIAAWKRPWNPPNAPRSAHCWNYRTRPACASRPLSAQRIAAKVAAPHSAYAAVSEFSVPSKL